ncbi:hypothetical protein PVZ87_19305 [Bordetella pertussis]|nr:hypothetical protein PVZ87_19305 [Bordetella pertussis]
MLNNDKLTTGHPGRGRRQCSRSRDGRGTATVAVYEIKRKNLAHARSPQPLAAACRWAASLPAGWSWPADLQLTRALSLQANLALVDPPL